MEDKDKEEKKEKEEEEDPCTEGELHTEYSGDICPRCGQEIKTDWTGGC